MTNTLKGLIISAGCLLLAAMIAIIAVVAVTTDSQIHKQNLSYYESTERINNPDQGFYRPLYVKMNDGGISYNKNVITPSTQLYHLRVDISAFSEEVNGLEDKPLTTAALDGFNELLLYLKSNEKNTIVRFAYDPSFSGAKDKEAGLQTILQHIKQVCPLLNQYEATVTAIEAGLIGPWGEMHSSAIANANNITPIIETFLDNTNNLPVLVRTPKMIYNYLGITLDDIDGYEITATEKAYRLGLYNDGYLGSDSDLGTYTSREREIEFLSKQTEHLPYGGEVVVPSSNLHDIETCLPEMFKINLNYLNVEWNNEVIAKWQNTVYTSACGSDSSYYDLSAFTYIENRMGYRFVVTDSTFRYSGSVKNLAVELKLKNVGFGNLNKKKSAKLIFVDASGSTACEVQVKDFAGEESLKYNLDLNLDGGKYEVYLCVYGEDLDGKPAYALQFANENIWDGTLKANKIGEIEVN